MNVNSAPSPSFGLKLDPFMQWQVLYKCKKFYSPKESKKILKMLKKEPSPYAYLKDFRLYKLDYNSDVRCDLFMTSSQTSEGKSKLISTVVGKFKQGAFPFEQIKKLINEP